MILKTSGSNEGTTLVRWHKLSGFSFKQEYWLWQQEYYLLNSGLILGRDDVQMGHWRMYQFQQIFTTETFWV